MSIPSIAQSPYATQDIDRRTFLRSVTMSTLTQASLPAFGLIRQFGGASLMQSGAEQGIRVALLPGTVGLIGDAFCGFSYEKDQVAAPIFTGENRNLIGLFRRLGPGLLRLGGATCRSGRAGFSWDVHFAVR